MSALDYLVRLYREKTGIPVNDASSRDFMEFKPGCWLVDRPTQHSMARPISFRESTMSFLGKDAEFHEKKP